MQIFNFAKLTKCRSIIADRVCTIETILLIDSKVFSIKQGSNHPYVAGQRNKK